MVTLEDFRAAQQRIAPVAVRTGLHRVLPQRLDDSGIGPLPFALYIKAESEQPIGSFKLRGGYNRIAQLSPKELRRGVITYSSGNHAQAVAYAARALGGKAVIVMPESAPLVKREATAAMGAEIVLVGPASSERKAKAEELAAEHDYTIIPPYDDPAIIAGQGTCGLEILDQLGPDAVQDALILSPVSGGGLLSGIATAVKLAAPAAENVQVWGAEPELAADAKESFETKRLVEWPAAKTTRTVCDGLRTQSLGNLNFEHILRYVDGITTVSEDQIRAAMRVVLQTTGLFAEPSGAVSVAAALFRRDELPKSKTVVAVLSGGNIEPELRRELEAGVAVALPVERG
ncbi:MAG TPA: threonine/serine dehydratase [Acidobacteriaceae bacterium]|nr:threonine/serine dehydratase [Acidobacteriaceae bacterium]